MSNVGAELRKQREAQGKPRVEVARDTGIYIHYLAALEHGNFDNLPDDDTVAGFVRVYAEYLGFLPDEPVAEFWAERRGKASPRAPEEPPEETGDGAAVEPAPEAGESETVAAGAAPEPVEAGPTRAPAVPSSPPTIPRRMAWPWLVAGATVVVAAVVAVVVWLPSPGGPETEPPAVPPAPAPRATRMPEPAPPPTEPASTSPAPTLSVAEHGVGTGVENRRLVGESDRFRLGTRVWFWTRVLGGTRGDAIEHVWIHDGRVVATIPLAVGSASWRTQSAKTMFEGSAGRWGVEARDRSGNVLARSAFTCEP